jgi:hypothetical protein
MMNTCWIFTHELCSAKLSYSIRPKRLGSTKIR